MMDQPQSDAILVRDTCCFRARLFSWWISEAKLETGYNIISARLLSRTADFIVGAVVVSGAV
jgi:hypothetical protein